MASLMVPSFYSATLLGQHQAAAPFTEATPCWRGILAVEPDIAVLEAKTLLLTRANYSVMKASNDRELFALRASKAIALAILSDRLGQRLLRTVAETVRRQWPRTRILILGQVPRILEDHLYDEQIHRSSDPQQVLADLETLYEGVWNQGSYTLDWKAASSGRHSARPPIPESDPTKTPKPAPADDQNLRDRPADTRLPPAKNC